MNLFLDALSEYIKDEWDRVFNDTPEPWETRFIVKSLDPESAFGLFHELEEHRRRWLQRIDGLRCYFRVANGLWKAWCEKPGSKNRLERRMRELGGLGPVGERRWIDEEDRLTWYRNRTAREEGSPGLVVVLVGWEHATDQGGLADFHLVDNERIWRSMDRSYLPWLEKINERLDYQAGPVELGKFETFLHDLAKSRPIPLDLLASFFEHEVLDGYDPVRMADVAEVFFEKLPYWGIPPILFGDRVLGGSTAKVKAALKQAAEFISHRRYKTMSNQNKDWAKIEIEAKNGNLIAPRTVGHAPSFEDTDEYLATVKRFIFEADTEASLRLQRTDFLPLHEILKRKENRKTSSRGVSRYTGGSLEAIVQGVWEALEQVQKNLSGELAENLDRVVIRLVRFDHDLPDDSETGMDRNLLAERLLEGCLGGLDRVIGDIKLAFPADVEESQQPREQWSRRIPLELELGFEEVGEVKFGRSRAKPSVTFQVTGSRQIQKTFKWALGPAQAERVRYYCAKAVLEHWEQVQRPDRLLPVFKVSSDVIKALHFAADETEANRLIAQSLIGLEVENLIDDLDLTRFESDLKEKLEGFIRAYREWLKAIVQHGYYTAQKNHVYQVVRQFEVVAKAVLDREKRGSTEILPRFYKALLVVDDRLRPGDGFLPGAVAWSLTPAVAELVQAQTKFLSEGFPEVVAELAASPKKGGAKAQFDRLLELARIHRPLAGLIVDPDLKLSAVTKPFGLIHVFGTTPEDRFSLAVQALLEESGDDGDENDRDITLPREEQGVVKQTLWDYQRLYPFAEDGLHILAVNVEDLGTILSGVDEFLREYLKKTSSEWPPFQFDLMVYSTSSSPLAVERKLGWWRNSFLVQRKENQRPLLINVAHRHAPNIQLIASHLRKEKKMFDVAFLFHFLRSGLTGRIDPAEKFEYDFGHWMGVQFPITEHPRPIKRAEPTGRQIRLSSRRLRVQSCHSNLTARLHSKGDTHDDHVVYGIVDYKHWSGVVNDLHGRAQWVACVDPFVDKRLLCVDGGCERRKIVGFSSGLGSFGELNLTVSTEQDTLQGLCIRVSEELTRLFQFDKDEQLESMAARIVGESEEVIGLASLRAVVGDGEQIREVVGFAAIQRILLAPDNATMTQLVPLDSLRHWFRDAEGGSRPDLLQLSLELRPNDIPLVHAVLVECKLAEENPEHVRNGFSQITKGLHHLMSLLAPDHEGLPRRSFDRRYWWGQLHRAITTRSVVDLSGKEWEGLDNALEKLTEGRFEIRWHAAIFTFWTNVASDELVVDRRTSPNNFAREPFIVPESFSVGHIALGYDGILKVFSEAQNSPILYRPDGPAIRIRAQQHREDWDARDAASSNGRLTPVSGPEAMTGDGLDAERDETDHSPVRGKSSLPESSEGLDKTPPPQTLDEPVSHSEFEARPKEEPDQIIEMTEYSRCPQEVLIGESRRGRPIYWQYGHPDLPNRHMLIFGSTGSGKTYAIQCLLAEMAAQKLHSLIVDYTDGFLPKQSEVMFAKIARPQHHFVHHTGLPINPLKRQSHFIDESIPLAEEKPIDVALRIVSIFRSIYPDLGSQQIASLTRALESGIEEGAAFTLNNLLDRLENEGSFGQSVANKLMPLIRAEPFQPGAEAPWEEMLKTANYWVHILQLSGFDRDTQRMITEFVLWDLWDYVTKTGSKNTPVPLVLDEIQNLDHSSDSPIDKMLREGRKYGVSLMLATQTTSNFSQEERDRLFQAGHKLFFKPASTETERFAKILAQTTPGINSAEWKSRLSRLKKGECYSLGLTVDTHGETEEEPLLVKITAFEDRDFSVVE